MPYTITVSPAFSPEKIIEGTIGKFWDEFKKSAYETMPDLILNYMRTAIGSSVHRARSTGHLAKSMTIWRDSDTTDHIAWGIGHIPTLRKVAKYFFVVNFGRKFKGGPFIPGEGKGDKYRPVMFGNSPVDAGLRGRSPKGAPRATAVRKISSSNEHAPSTIANPLNYIEKTNRRLQIEVRKLLQKLSKD